MQIANTKRGHMVGFEDITAEFAPEFQGVKDLAEELRYILGKYRLVRGQHCDIED